MKPFFEILGATIFDNLVATLSPPCTRFLGRGAAESAKSQVELPRDDGSHGSLLEWWYWTGHLRAASGHRFGFALVFFEVRPFGITVQVTHHAVTDVENASFHFRTERPAISRRAPVQGIDLSHNGLWAKGADGNDRLHGEVDGLGLDLELVSQKAPVLQHDRGYIAYDFGGSAYYYSRQRLAARGSLEIAGEKLAVEGAGWFDHQWGDMGRVFARAWDWFGIQLDDGREMMLFVMRVLGEERLRGGSCTSAEGKTTRLDPAEIEIEPLGAWRSPHTGCAYPRRWRLGIKGEEFLLSPLVMDQELWDSIPLYWEGAAEVSGSAGGMAYIEMNNYRG